MGYNLYIGESKLESDIEEYWCRWTAKPKILKKAPFFEGDDLSNHNNSRSPSYTQWWDFCKEVNLIDVFYEDRGFKGGHPGCFKLTKEHLITFREALKKREQIDKRPAGLDERYINNIFAKFPDGEETHDYNKVRLIWLIWWTNWALNNCKNPTFSNS